MWHYRIKTTTQEPHMNATSPLPYKPEGGEWSIPTPVQHQRRAIWSLLLTSVLLAILAINVASMI
jgi:hypothetical protein